ncbi:hypothetical protein M011DRAFT_453787 [Sporormia fimetaria CBS 119925]|uniref:Spindle pole body component n=1 Tax=Sporormia fimetaria CBS 119925 TaxID=1340428 RepID=A0A6A6UXA1_9PLEO|nr:hypothetical protein M011DRAFT_453787 [Sporormia fimetaria CBS 119925]
MEADVEHGDSFAYRPFATENLWKPSPFFHDPVVFESFLFACPELDVSAIRLDNPYAPRHALDRELQLPGLDSFEFGELPELPSLSDSCSEAPQLEPGDEDEVLWSDAAYDESPHPAAQFFTWEAFEGHSSAKLTSPYLTEAGPRALDAALAEDGDARGQRIARHDILLDSLFNLGLGRLSKLFGWDAKSRTFVPLLPGTSASGLSVSSWKSVQDNFIWTGNTILYLRSFVARTFSTPTSLSGKVALATSVSSILTAFEEHVGHQAKSVRSLLQLQALFNGPREILIHISHMVDAVRHVGSNEQLASVLHQRILEIEDDEPLRRLLSTILLRVSRPSIELIGEWIGIYQEQAALPAQDRESFFVIEDAEDQAPLQFAYRPDAMMGFVTAEDGDMIFETGKSLRFIRSHHPDHPLASLSHHGIQAPELEWKFGWDEIQRLSAKAQRYEEALREAIRDATGDTGRKMHLPETNTAGGEAPMHNENPDHDFFAHQFDISAKLIDAPPGDDTPDELRRLTSQMLDGTSTQTHRTSSPPLALTWTLSLRPLLCAQARLVNAASLRLFFRCHQLRMHFDLQRQYHLLGDGVFSSRLASALFDPDREMAERQKGTMRSGVDMGLQLGSRSTWPPASSELRLALMGLLNESFFSSSLYQATVGREHTEDGRHKVKASGELPGQMNFAVRHLSEAEMEKIMDPDSLYALDFLRLQYVPPSPLHLVITPKALEKYDEVFRFLLRLLRMVFVVSRLPRSGPTAAHRHFRMEAQHFVTCLSAYMLQTGIAEHWSEFAFFLSATEDKLNDEDVAGDFGGRVRMGLESIRKAHEQCLDSILFSLLLRRRQKRVMGLLEEIFEHILLFAKLVRDDAQGKQRAQVRDLYGRVRGKIRVFISVVKGLTGKRGYGKSKGAAEENTLERLGLVLEMNGYYSA